MSKTKVLRYQKVMISKFYPTRHIILIFERRILPAPWTIWAFQGVSHFSSKCSSIVYAKSTLDLMGQFFLKMMLGGHFWMGGQKKSRGGGARTYHGWCHVRNLDRLFFMPFHDAYLIFFNFLLWNIYANG